MAERNDTFWRAKEVQLSTFESSWYKEKVNTESKDSKDYSMGGTLNGDLEKIVGNHLVLAGPMVDGYLRQIGLAINAKLCRNTTGLAPPIVMYVPWQIQRHMAPLCIGYGAEVKMLNNNNPKKEKMIIFIENDDTAQKVFNPKRFDGSYYLAKRKFKKVVEDNKAENGNKMKTVYGGIAKVVVTTRTPLRFDYLFQKQTLTVTFYIQRYNENGFAIDATVQAMLNVNTS